MGFIHLRRPAQDGSAFRVPGGASGEVDDKGRPGKPGVKPQKDATKYGRMVLRWRKTCCFHRIACHCLVSNLSASFLGPTFLSEDSAPLLGMSKQQIENRHHIQYIHIYPSRGYLGFGQFFLACLESKECGVPEIVSGQSGGVRVWHSAFPWRKVPWKLWHDVSLAGLIHH